MENVDKIEAIKDEEIHPEQIHLLPEEIFIKRMVDDESVYFDANKEIGNLSEFEQEVIIGVYKLIKVVKVINESSIVAEKELI